MATEIKCSVCGSTDVEIKTWIHCNHVVTIHANNMFEMSKNINELMLSDCWCNKCKKHTELKLETHE